MLLTLFITLRGARSDENERLSRWWDGRLDCNHSAPAAMVRKTCHGAAPQFAHVWYAGPASRPIDKMNKTWLGAFTKRHSWAGKRVVDFGIGAGILGFHLLKNEAISHYTGIDISNRSIKEAASRLKKLDRRGTTWSLLRAPQPFAPLRADIFVCVAVVQHFPSRVHAEGFFANLRDSGIPTIVLQIKNADPPFFLDERKFDMAAYDRQGVDACMFSPRYLRTTLLPNYDVVWQQPLRPRKYKEPWWVEMRLRTGQ